jgi:hypothetical protein
MNWDKYNESLVKERRKKEKKSLLSAIEYNEK